MKALSTNKLVNNAAYPKILEQYNERLQSDGKVNNKKFWEDVVRKEIPSYSMQSWYFFLKRFKTEYGILKAEVMPDGANLNLPSSTEEGIQKVARTLLSNSQATVNLIQGLLNISADAAREIIEHPEKLSAKDRLDLGIKAMKAQDSRIHAVGKIREDSREQEKFDRAFEGANY